MENFHPTLPKNKTFFGYKYEYLGVKGWASRGTPLLWMRDDVDQGGLTTTHARRALLGPLRIIIFGKFSFDKISFSKGCVQRGVSETEKVCVCEAPPLVDSHFCFNCVNYSIIYLIMLISRD